MAGNATPVMRQHAEAKAAYPDSVIFFRLGDFYEMFGDDAVLCARVLNLTLTSRNKGKPDEIPMAGVPHHAAHTYIGRMLAAGYRIAICEQMADPKTVKGIVPRAVVRVLSPGLITNDEHLAAGENNWLASAVLGKREASIALLDISTGEFRVASAPDFAALASELAHAAPKEVLVVARTDEHERDREEAISSLQSLLPRASVLPAEALTPEQSAEAFAGLENDRAALSEEEQAAAATVLVFARRCTPAAELPVRAIGRWDPGSALALDPNTQRHLELVESNGDDKTANLLAVLGNTKTSAGARLLRARLLAPLLDVAQIRRRHDAVEMFLLQPAIRDGVRADLGQVGDMERIVARVALGEATPRELGILRDSLQGADAIVERLRSLDYPGASEAWGLDDEINLVPALRQTLEGALVESPPAQAKEGEIFRDGFDSELTRYASLKLEGAGLVLALEARLREETQIANLRVKYTRVFGWYVEVGRSAQGKVPKAWRRKQTVATGERYTLDELDELALQLGEAEELHRARELSLVKELNAAVRDASDALRALAFRLAVWDVGACLAEVAHRYDYVRPLVDESDRLELTEARHPVVERLAERGSFVPNDVALEANAERVWLITGPNMAGKSTFLRQTALCVILAQMGGFVPAKAARVGVVDRVLSRVGASDNLARGESTFMVEMKETASILRYATSRSLVILDEIGRGTSTFDGLSIAWAVLEHLDEVVRCRALFATHYHELTQLADSSAAVANLSVSAREQAGKIVFLHRVVRGAASRSYGVAVARLAGLPEGVVARAEAILAGLESDGQSGASPGAPRHRAGGAAQLSLFAGAPAQDPRHAEIASTLEHVSVERLTPLGALQLIAKLKKLL